MGIGVSIATGVITKKLREDAEFRESFKSAIAMEFKDEFHRKKKECGYIGKEAVHDIANTAAENFINLWSKERTSPYNGWHSSCITHYQRIVA